MDIELTAATKRALVEAWSWSLDGSDLFLQAPAVLLGLLLERECRAAILLESHEIHAATIQTRWPTLLQKGSIAGAAHAPIMDEALSEELVPRFSPEMRAAFGIARDWLTDLPRPLTLATEHLLLGLAASEQEVGCWLRQRGLNAQALRDEILKQYGLTTAPLDVETAVPVSIDVPQEDIRPQVPDSKDVIPDSSSGDHRAETGERLLGNTNVVRLLDASANRAREALRVIEDYVRFVLDDRHLTARLKSLRHGLTSALAGISMTDRLATRDTQADVGTTLSTAAERIRRDSHEVLTANFTRFQESLRSLEEFGKIDRLLNSQVVEQLRYEAYTLHKAVHGTLEGLARLDGAVLYVLVDGRSSVDTFEKLVSSLVEAGVSVIQLRDKTLDDRGLLERAHRLRDLTSSRETLFIMNDRPDLAVLARADGVHVGQEELTVRQVRQIVGPRMLVGVSTHGIEQARQAVLDGASYLGVGPMFPSGTKAFTEFPGLAFARCVAAEIRLPAFAIGGIEAKNVAQVIATGIGRVAVSGAVISAEDPARAARDLLDRLKVAE